MIGERVFVLSEARADSRGSRGSLGEAMDATVDGGDAIFVKDGEKMFQVASTGGGDGGYGVERAAELGNGGIKDGRVSFGRLTSDEEVLVLFRGKIEGRLLTRTEKQRRAEIGVEESLNVDTDSGLESEFLKTFIGVTCVAEFAENLAQLGNLQLKTCDINLLASPTSSGCHSVALCPRRRRRRRDHDVIRKNCLT